MTKTPVQKLRDILLKDHNIVVDWLDVARGYERTGRHSHTFRWSACGLRDGQRIEVNSHNTVTDCIKGMTIEHTRTFPDHVHTATATTVTSKWLERQ